MRKAMTFILIFAGAVFTVFVLNIVMYATIPEYRSVVSSSVATSDEIPVVSPSAPAKELSAPEDEQDQIYIPITEPQTPMAESVMDAIYTEDTAEEEDTPEIVSKEYHEDCGT